MRKPVELKLNGNPKYLQKCRSEPRLDKVIHCNSPERKEPQQRYDKTPKRTQQQQIVNSNSIFLLLEKSPYKHKLSKLRKCSPSKDDKHLHQMVLVPFPLNTNNKHKMRECARIARANSRDNTNSSLYSIETFTKEHEVSWEDILLMEDKYHTLISDIKKKNFIINDCIEWLNCFIVSPMCANNVHARKLNEMNTNTNYNYICCLLMYSIMFCYFNALLRSVGLNDYDPFLLDLMLYHHRLFLVIVAFYITNSNSTNTPSSSEDTDIKNKLLRQIQTYFNYNNSNDTALLPDINKYFNNLNNTCNQLVTKFSAASLPGFDAPALIALYSHLNAKTPLEMNNFFLNYFLRRSFPSSLRNLLNLKQLAGPYMKNKCLKKFTLVLDLDETLIHSNRESRVNGVANKKHVVHYRPGLAEFLESVSQFFELIVFTVGLAEYANPIIDSMEMNGKIFSNRLYRDHAVVYQNDYVKDLSKIGRDLRRVIIVDDKPFNFCLQKENGIAIKPFYGKKEDNKDYALINLIPILLRITREHSGDVRTGIKKNKVDIVTKVSSFMYLNKTYK